MWQLDGWGARVRIGILMPNYDIGPEVEFAAMAPEGVTIHSTRVPSGVMPDYRDLMMTYRRGPGHVAGTCARNGGAGIWCYGIHLAPTRPGARGCGGRTATLALPARESLWNTNSN